MLSQNQDCFEKTMFAIWNGLRISIACCDKVDTNK